MSFSLITINLKSWLRTLIYFRCTSWFQTSFVIFSVIALIEARGGRGGGRGGRFSSRSRSSYRSSSRSRYVSKFSGNRISSKSQLRTAILLGTVYGATRWKSRSSYRRSGDCKSIIKKWFHMGQMWMLIKRFSFGIFSERLRFVLIVF